MEGEGGREAGRQAGRQAGREGGQERYLHTTQGKGAGGDDLVQRDKTRLECYSISTSLDLSY